MTHNIIHDEAQIKNLAEGFECWDSFYSGLTIEQETEHNTTKLYEKYLQDYIKDALSEYAEHTLVKFIDSEVERLRTLRTLEVDKIKTADDEKQENYFRGKVDFITDRIIEIEYHKLKAQLTKSK